MEKHTGQSESQNVELPARALVPSITEPLVLFIMDPISVGDYESTNYIMVWPDS